MDTQPAPVLQTDRLRLRRPEESDLPRIAELANDIDVARMTTRMPHPYAFKDAVEFYVRIQDHDSARERVFLVEDRQAGPAGMLGFHPNEEGRCEIGYWLGRPFWGRGLATEAAEAALAWAGEGWGRRYLTAGHFADNPRSGEVLCKTGFLYTGEVVKRRSLARAAEADTRMMVWLA